MRVVASPEEHALITSKPEELLAQRQKAAEQQKIPQGIDKQKKPTKT